MAREVDIVTTEPKPSRERVGRLMGRLLDATIYHLVQRNRSIHQKGGIDERDSVYGGGVDVW